MIVAVTILFASITFALYRRPPSTWLLPRSIRLLLTNTVPENPDEKVTLATFLKENANTEKNSHGDPEIRSSGSYNRERESKKSLKAASIEKGIVPSPPSVILLQSQDPDEEKRDLERNQKQKIQDDLKPSSQRDSRLMPPPPAPPSAPGILGKSPATASGQTAKLRSSATANRTSSLASTIQQSRINTSSLMSPPSSLRPPQTSSLTTSTLSPSSNAKPRKKVILAPGHSPLDWANRLRSGENLAGVPSLQRVSPSTLKYNNGRKGRPAWSSYHGKVYNITPYLGYHPGGEGELMRAAGKDGGKLFMEVHPWVSWESMLDGCLVGIMVRENDGVAIGGGDGDESGSLDDIE